ncbi:MAG: hypothetical protein LEGION0398_MBIBDBAK_00321 [Legionellaceae bacterium]
MRQYSIAKALPLSFFSFSLYQDIRKNWRTRSVFAYLFILTALTCLPYVYFSNQWASFFTQQVISPLLKQFPSLHIEQGKLTTEKKQPYFIKEYNNEKIIGIIDTSGKYTSLDKKNTYFLITQDNMFYKTKENEIKNYSLDQVKQTITLNKTIITQYLSSIEKYYAFIFFGIGFVLLLLWHLSLTLFSFLACLIFAQSKNRLFPFSHIFRLAIIALTPVVILSTVMNIFHLHFAFQSFVKFCIIIFYSYFAIKANSTQPQGV